MLLFLYYMNVCMCVSIHTYVIQFQFITTFNLMCLVGFMLHSCWRLVAREIGWSDNDVSCSSHNVVVLLLAVVSKYLCSVFFLSLLLSSLSYDLNSFFFWFYESFLKYTLVRIEQQEWCLGICLYDIFGRKIFIFFQIKFVLVGIWYLL